MREEDRRSGLALGCIESARKLDLSVGRAGRETWFDVVTGPVRYRASTSWSLADAVGVTLIAASLMRPAYGLMGWSRDGVPLHIGQEGRSPRVHTKQMPERR